MQTIIKFLWVVPGNFFQISALSILCPNGALTLRQLYNGPWVVKFIAAILWVYQYLGKIIFGQKIFE